MKRLVILLSFFLLIISCASKSNNGNKDKIDIGIRGVIDIRIK